MNKTIQNCSWLQIELQTIFFLVTLDIDFVRGDMATYRNIEQVAESSQYLSYGDFFFSAL